jgi:hypothetical protein
MLSPHCSKVTVRILLSFKHCPLYSDMTTGLTGYSPRMTSVIRVALGGRQVLLFWRSKFGPEAIFFEQAVLLLNSTVIYVTLG